ncbi:MAG: (d)CMP kinase [Hyphomicrobiales bacterium]|nr:(d)CMP kinase [Hyphomicrobiales bacterium]
MIIAIDGPAASGKGTLARRLAAHYGLNYLDTGLLYRAVAHALISRGLSPADEEAACAAARDLDPAALDEPALRGRGVGAAASIVAAIPGVRDLLRAFQRRFAASPPGAVMDGRDIGTVVCPDADVKLYVTASPEERARRRWKELTQSGEDAVLADILADLEHRDARDRERAVAPLRRATDAHLLDTTELDIEAAFRAAVELIDGSLSA